MAIFVVAGSLFIIIGVPTKLILEEVYAVGGGDTPDESFAEISALDVLKDGTVYVLDTKDSRVKVFDAKGKFLRAFGKAGQGPGELNQPVGILITPGNEVLIEDALNQRLAIFALLAEEGRLLVKTYEKGRAKKEYYWDVFDAEGRYIAKVPIVHEIRLGRDGKAYFFVEDEDGYKTLRCCRARWEK